jgi:2-polyprenyl-6-methoxyphenol hydroxylase-like FAD-dependent oxidoreductase
VQRLPERNLTKETRTMSRSTASPLEDSSYDADVVIVGAGPTGLTLATALAAQHIRTTVVDRLAEGLNTSRAGVIHARTLEVLEPLSVAAELEQRGIKATGFTIRDRDRVLVPIDFRKLPTRYPYTLMISQAVTEGILLRRFTGLGGHVLRPRSLVDLAQDDSGVVAEFDDGRRLRARYLVGADGMHSTVRERVNIAFAGGSYGESFALADVHLSGHAPRDEVRLYFSPAGMVVVAPLPEGIHRIVAVVDDAPEQPSVQFVQALLDSRGPQRERAIVCDVLWGSRFRVHHRVAETYRSGRVLLAGDAAHVHSPAGGQGMNAGILDAVSLAQALAAALGGDAAALDAYGDKRRPIAQQVVTFADRLTRLATVRPRLRLWRNLALSALAWLPPFRSQLAWRLSGLVYR